MLVYILFILVIFFLHNSLYIIPVGERRNKVEKAYLYIVAGILLLLTAIRGAGVGTDTRNYLIMYVHHVSDYSFSDIYPGLSGSPITFYIFKAFSSMHLPPQFLLAFIEFIYLSAIVRFINKFSKDKLYSFFCFFVVVLYAFSVTAIKQCTAMGLALHAFLDFYDKKRIRAIICLVLAYFAHKSSLIFLFGVLLYFMREKRQYYFIVVVVALLCLLAGNQLLTTFLEVLNDEHYVGYLNEEGRYTWITFIYYLVLFFFALLFKKQYDKCDKEESRIMYGFVIVAMALQSLSSVVPTAFRLSLYYVPFLIILLPNSFSVGAKLGQQFKLIVSVLLLFFYFYTNRNGGNIVPYEFFWQDYDIPYIKFGG